VSKFQLTESQVTEHQLDMKVTESLSIIKSDVKQGYKVQLLEFRQLGFCR